MRNRFRFNITQKFITYLILISIIPLVVVGYSGYQSFAKALQEESELYAKALVLNQRDYLDLQLEQIKTLIANITGVEEINNALVDSNKTHDAYDSLSTQAQIGYILNGHSNLRGLVSIDIFTLDDIHYHVGDTLDVSNIRYDVRDRLYDDALSSDQLILWSGIEDNVNKNSNHEKVITAAKIITNINRDTLREEPVALFLINYDIDDLYDHFSHIDLGKGAFLMAADANNRIIYHPDKSQIGQVLPEEISHLLMQETGTFLINYNHQDMSVSFARSVVSGWYVMSLTPIKTLQQKAASVQTTILLTLFLSFVFVAIAAWFYSRDVVQPIRQITLRFQQLQAGLPHAETPLPPHGNDEIGELVVWFNAFLDSLAARREAEAHIEASLQEKEVLLKEIHHRVKNNLQVISSLLNLQAGYVEADSKTLEALRDSQNRLRSMALIHDRLYRSKNLALVDFSEYIQNLASYLLGSYEVSPDRIHLVLDLEKVHLGIETAVPCGLITNELIANALQHAFPDHEQGTIRITLKKISSNQISLTIADDGVGLSQYRQDNNPDSLGLQLVETLVQQIDGTLTVHNEKGAHFTVSFMPVNKVGKT